MSFSVIGLGEVLWDLLPAGPQLGGAPANFAYQAKTLGAHAQVLSRIGNDPLGQDIQARFKRLQLPTDSLQIDNHWPTGTVEVSLTSQGIPDYRFPDNVAWDRVEATAAALNTVKQADAICFGTLAQRSPQSRGAIQQLIAATPEGALRVFDINLRQNFYSQSIIEASLGLANVLKLNDEELAVLTTMLSLPEGIRDALLSLAETYQLNTVVLTCGAKGSLMLQQGQWSEQQPSEVAMVDTVGAGDAFTAGLTMGLLSGLSLTDIHRQAEAQAGLACEQSGGIPDIKEPLGHS